MTNAMLLRRPALVLAAGSLLLAGLTAAPLGQVAAGVAAAPLPLGDSDLVEVRSVQPLATGVTLTRIVRGTDPAADDDIATTTRGPWRVNVLTIDPDRARGRLEATYGPDLAQVEPTSSLVTTAGALAGVNSSFFTFGHNPAYPGDPVGLGLYAGAVLSEPAAVRTEVDLLVDARTNKVRIGRLTWSGSLRNTSTGKKLKLEFLNHPPVVPRGCAGLEDPRTCKKSGDLVYVQRPFGPTPAGPGVEVVLRSGCVVRSATVRGTVLLAGQSSVQATGKQALKLWALTRKGCLSRKVTLYDEHHKKVNLRSSLYGVAGRYRLTTSGRIVVPRGHGAFFARNPRTLAGTTATGKILLVTIDGRRSTSVGATLAEAAAVAHALGITNALNLDGGGSTTMAVAAGVVNQPSHSSERAVGDALVYVDRPLG